jgi:hypothetical protein
MSCGQLVFPARQAKLIEPSSPPRCSIGGISGPTTGRVSKAMSNSIVGDFYSSMTCVRTSAPAGLPIQRLAHP